ncbi:MULTISPECIES: hypothetical protein [Xenorhabdus]|uniref:hypothetical protein n=1 Tax=Xenorhabdus TaxID=626 RepID=UPI0006486FFC|nr:MULTISPECIES: hypothetical protein [Xenorhabdus]
MRKGKNNIRKKIRKETKHQLKERVIDNIIAWTVTFVLIIPIVLCGFLTKFTKDTIANNIIASATFGLFLAAVATLFIVFCDFARKKPNT